MVQGSFYIHTEKVLDMGTSLITAQCWQKSVLWPLSRWSGDRPHICHVVLTCSVQLFNSPEERKAVVHIMSKLIYSISLHLLLPESLQDMSRGRSINIQLVPVAFFCRGIYISLPMEIRKTLSALWPCSSWPAFLFMLHTTFPHAGRSALLTGRACNQRPLFIKAT